MTTFIRKLGTRLSTQALRPASSFAATQSGSFLRPATSQANRFSMGNTREFSTSNRAGSFGTPSAFFCSKAVDYIPDVSARMNKMKELFKFRNKVAQSKLTGDNLVKESELFCKLIMACSTEHGLSAKQRNLCVPYVRIYSGAPVDGSADNPSAKAQLGVIAKDYPDDKKKTTLEEVRAIGLAIDKLYKGSEEAAILKRSALYIAVQLIALDRPFAKADKNWIVKVAQALNIDPKEEHALTALSVLDHTHTPFGPKPALSKDTYEQVVRELDDVHQQMNALYLSGSQLSM